MSEYTITDLRGDLAETIRALRTGDEKMTVEKAKAIEGLAQTMINSAKVEVDMLKTVGRGRFTPSGFLPLEHKDTLDHQQAAERAQLSGPAPKPHIRNPVGTAPRGSL